MLQRHPNCENQRCAVCLEDAAALGQHLIKLTGDTYHDLLGEYHTWLSKHDIPPQTEHGWPTEQAYDDANINAFADERARAVGGHDA